MKIPVGIIGAGPAGLMLSHLLHLQGIETVVLETRNRADVEETIRAGVLEQNTVDLMIDTGVGDRLKLEGLVHHGIELRFNGRGHRIAFDELTDGRVVTIYPQHKVLQDLVERRLRDGGKLLFGVSDVAVNDHTTDNPSISFTDDAGRPQRLECTLVAGCDGSRTHTRSLIPEATVRRDYFRQYPFAWFGILAEAPPSSSELIYAHHPNGFALISTRSAQVQRHYLQIEPTDSIDSWSDDRIWAELHARVGGEGANINERRIFHKSILRFRSFVCDPMQHGNLFLAGDAAHTVPPTGAKGMNLAIADVYILANAMASYLRKGSREALERYTFTAMPRVWRAQHFSWWMTSMLHTVPAATGFDLNRQLAELEAVTSSVAGRTLIAENYTGLPLDTL